MSSREYNNKKRQVGLSSCRGQIVHAVLDLFNVGVNNELGYLLNVQ